MFLKLSQVQERSDRYTRTFPQNNGAFQLLELHKRKGGSSTRESSLDEEISQGLATPCSPEHDAALCDLASFMSRDNGSAEPCLAPVSNFDDKIPPTPGTSWFLTSRVALTNDWVNSPSRAQGARDPELAALVFTASSFFVRQSVEKDSSLPVVGVAEHLYCVQPVILRLPKEQKRDT